MPFDPQEKFPGDLIQADDWNSAMDEIKRLETDKLTVTADARVGIGENNPDSALHVRGGSEPVIKIQSDENGSISARLALRQNNERGADLYFDGRDDNTSERPEAFVIATNNTIDDDSIADQIRFVIEVATGHVGIGRRNPGHPLHMVDGAHCTGTDWVNECSRSSKTEVEPLDLERARATVSDLSPVVYRYRRGDGHDRVGFIAEDVPDLVAQPDRKGLSPMDILGVLTKVVQDQQREIEDLRARIAALAGSGTD